MFSCRLMKDTCQLCSEGTCFKILCYFCSYQVRNGCSAPSVHSALRQSLLKTTQPSERLALMLVEWKKA